MIARIDGDILAYELGFSTQGKDEEGNPIYWGWDRVEELVDGVIKRIVEESGADEYIIYLTDNEFINRIVNKDKLRYNEDDIKELVQNFRYGVATTRPYKSTRLAEKPYHYESILLYLLTLQPSFVAVNGLEADDYMCIHQMEDIENSIICSRDKDLRQCEGWHYSWETSISNGIGPVRTDRLGWLEDRNKGKLKENGEPKDPNWIGFGDKWFWFQMIVGDPVDTIPGCKGKGKAHALNGLFDAKTVEECEEFVVSTYKDVYGEEWEDVFLEQGDLLWMVREMDSNGDPIYFSSKFT